MKLSYQEASSKAWEYMSDIPVSDNPIKDDLDYYFMVRSLRVVYEALVDDFLNDFVDQDGDWNSFFERHGIESLSLYMLVKVDGIVTTIDRDQIVDEDGFALYDEYLFYDQKEDELIFSYTAEDVEAIVFKYWS